MQYRRDERVELAFNWDGIGGAEKEKGRREIAPPPREPIG
jgi:hypothetical protein